MADTWLRQPSQPNFLTVAHLLGVDEQCGIELGVIHRPPRSRAPHLLPLLLEPAAAQIDVVELSGQGRRCR